MATRNPDSKPAAAKAKTNTKAKMPGGGGSAIGSSGLRQTGGYVTEETNPALSGLQGLKIFRQMSEQDDTVGAVLFAIGMLIRSSEWKVQPADDTPKAEKAAEFLDEVILDMDVTMADIMDEIVTMFTFGFAPMEIVYRPRTKSSGSKYDDNKVGVRGLYLRSQETVQKWVFDDSNDELLGMVQQPYNGPSVEIPIDRLLLFRTTRAKNNPTGRPLLRAAYRNWTFKKRLQEIEGIGMERDLAGLPVGKVPGNLFAKNASADEKATLAQWQQIVTTVRRDQAEGLLIPSTRDQQGNPLYEFELVSTGGARAFDTSKVIDRYDRGIATSVLADFIFLGQSSVGSFALSSDKTALFATAIQGFLNLIEQVLHKGLVERVWELNGMDEDLIPSLKPTDLEHQSIAEVGQLLSSMSGAGAMLFPDRKLENALRKIGGLPEAPEDEDEMALDPRYQAAGMMAPDDPNNPNNPDSLNNPNNPAHPSNQKGGQNGQQGQGGSGDLWDGFR